VKKPLLPGKRLAWSLTWRVLVVLPLIPLVIALMISYVGIPVGLLLGLWIGAFVTKPIRKLPMYNLNPKDYHYNEPDRDIDYLIHEYTEEGDI
jgi:hypothetical protein